MTTSITQPLGVEGFVGDDWEERTSGLVAEWTDATEIIDEFDWGDNSSQQHDLTFTNDLSDDTIHNDHTHADEQIDNVQNFQAPPAMTTRYKSKKIVRPRKNLFDDKGIRLYCICSKPDVGKFMIACDYCKEWFHGTCVGVTQRISDTLDEYQCPPCQAFYAQLGLSRDPTPAPQPVIETRRRSSVNKRRKSLTIDTDETWEPLEPSLQDEKRRKSSKQSPQPRSAGFSKPSKPGKSTLTDQASEKLRRVALTRLESSISEIFEMKVDYTPTIDLDAKEFARQVELELFEQFKKSDTECGPKYSVKFRTIQSNLKDTKNEKLRKRILTGEITPYKLVNMAPEELANDDVKQRAMQVRNRTILETVKTEEQLPMLKKTHKGEFEVVTREFKVPELKIEKQPALAPPKIETLDEILAKMENDKRNEIKKESIKQEDFNDEYIVKNEDGQMELRSPSLSPVPEDNGNQVVWAGKVVMPQVAKFNGVCRQVAGRKVGTIKTWEDVLPVQINIDGRIPTSRVADYVSLQKGSATKEVVVVEYVPEETKEDEEGFEKLYEYFESKGRCAVVGQHYVSIKDMYIVPLAAGQKLPEFLREIADENRIEEKKSLVGVIILVKQFLENGRTKKSGKSGNRHVSNADPGVNYVTKSTVNTPTTPIMPTSVPIPMPTASIPAPMIPGYGQGISSGGIMAGLQLGTPTLFSNPVQNQVSSLQAVSQLSQIIASITAAQQQNQNNLNQGNNAAANQLLDLLKR